jgi:hypothetical protein
MKPKEKAKELADRYYWVFGDGYLGDQHIQCALIAVDEILKDKEIVDGMRVINDPYWLEVKQEIEKNYGTETNKD